MIAAANVRQPVKLFIIGYRMMIRAAGGVIMGRWNDILQEGQ
jgi:hypothetical protein